MVDTVRPEHEIIASLTGTGIEYISDQEVRDAVLSALRIPVMVYSHHSGNQAQSLSHRQGVAVNDTYMTLYYGSDRQSASGAVWQLYTTTTNGSAGDINQVAGVGLVLEGVSGRYKLIPGPGNIVDIRCANIVCDGETTGQHSRLSECIAAAREFGWFLVNTLGAGIAQESASASGTMFRATETIDARFINCDLMIQAADQGDVVDGVRFYTGVESGITTDAIDGVTKGIVVRGGGNLSNRQRQVQRFWVQGDGIFDNHLQATTIGVVLESNDSGLGDYQVYGGYNSALCMVKGSHEKHTITVKGTFNNHLFYAPTDGTPDTLYVYLGGQNNWHLIKEEDAFDGSYHYFMNHEARSDPGDQTPAIKISGGKLSSIGGELRGINGSKIMEVDKTTSIGVDSFYIRSLVIFDSFGTIDFKRCRRLGGELYLREMKPPNDGQPDAPTVKFGRVISPALKIHLSLCTAAEGIHIGDATNYSVDATYGPFYIQMGNTDPFTGGFPTSSIAINIEKMTGGTVDVPHCMGQVTLGAAATGVDIKLENAAKRYTLTRAAGETCVVKYGGIVATVIDADGRTLTANESGNEYSNFGAAARADYTLPAAAAGLEFSFVNMDAEGTRVIAGVGDVINVGGISIAAGHIDATAIGAYITLKAVDVTNWIATNAVDAADWVADAPPAVSSFFAEIAGDTPWYDNIEPASVYFADTDTTWIAWEGHNGNLREIYVTTYNHTTDAWTPVVVAATQTLALSDNHGTPALDRLGGYVFILYGAHNTGQQLTRTTAQNDPLAWTPQTSFGSDLAYPHPYVIGTTAFVFSRSNERILRVTPLTQSGGTFTAGTPVDIIDVTASSRIYQGTGWVVGNDIYFSATRSTAADDARENIYVLVVETNGAGTITGVRNFDDTTTILAASFPVTNANLDASFRVYEHIGSNNWTSGPAACLDTNGHPHVLFTVGISTGSPGTQAGDVRHIWHNGTAWQADVPVASITEVESPVGLVPLAAGAVEAYYLMDTGNIWAGGAGDQIFRKVWTEGGGWGSAELVLQATDNGLGKVQMVRNGHADARVIMRESAPLASVDKLLKFYVSGDGGFISRVVTHAGAYVAGIPAVTKVAVDGTSHVVTLPVGIVSGEDVHVAICSDGNVTITPVDVEWTAATNCTGLMAGSVSRINVYHRVADGSWPGVATTATFTTSGSEESVSIAWRVKAHSSTTINPEGAAAVNASTASPDPPAHTPAAGSKAYLWFAVWGCDSSALVAAPTYPAGYRSLSVGESSNNAGASAIGIAWKELTGTTDNPGTFPSTLTGSVATRAYTYVVHPGSEGA